MAKKLNPKNKYEKGMWMLFDKFEREDDFGKSIEILKDLNKKKDKYKKELGAEFALDLKKNIRDVCEQRIHSTYNYLKNEFPKLKVDGYVNQRYITAAEIVDWLNALADEEGIPLYKILKKYKIMGSEGEYKVMLYKIYDRASRAEIINSVKLVKNILRKGGDGYDAVLTSLNNAEEYAKQASKLKRASEISPSVKRHIVMGYDKSIKGYRKKLLRSEREYDLETYEGFSKAKRDLYIVEFCKKHIEGLTKKEYPIEGLNKIKNTLMSKWASAADSHSNEMIGLYNKLLNLDKNYELSYEGVKNAENDYEKLKIDKNDYETLSGEECKIELNAIKEKIKEYKLRATSQYDRAARKIYAKLAKYSENYNLDSPVGRKNAKTDIKNLEETQKKIEDLIGNTYPINGLETIKNMIEKKEALAAPTQRLEKKRDDSGFDQEDFMQRMFKEKFGMRL